MMLVHTKWCSIKILISQGHYIIFYSTETRLIVITVDDNNNHRALVDGVDALDSTSATSTTLT